MSKGLVHTPCKLLLFDDKSCVLSEVSSFEVADCQKIQAVVCNGVVFALNEFACRLLTELSLDETKLKAVSPDDIVQVKKAKDSGLLKKTVEMLRPHCNVDDGELSFPLLLWNE